MFRKAVIFTSGCCLLALGAVLLQACFFPYGGTGGATGINLSGLWEGTLTFTHGGGGWAGVSTTFMITFVEPDAGGVSGSAKMSWVSSFYGMKHAVGPVFGMRSGNTLTFFVGTLKGSGTHEFSGTLSDYTLSGTFKSAQELDPHEQTDAGTWQVTRTHKYYAKGP